jgi:hypothetical protein
VEIVLIQKIAGWADMNSRVDAISEECRIIGVAHSHEAYTRGSIEQAELVFARALSA